MGAAFAVVGLAVPAALAAASPEATLAERYAPVVRLVKQHTPCGAGEPYQPLPADVVLASDQVALRGPWDAHDLIKVAPTAGDLAVGLENYHLDLPGDALRPGCTYEQWERELDATAAPTTYARVRSEAGQTALQYWFFYIFNDYNDKHEGDWEMIQLDFPAADAAAATATSPTEVGFSQHNGGERAAWDDAKLERVDGTHPVVYAAAGSHANYFGPALYLGSSAAEGVGCDDTRGPWRELHPAVKLVPTDPAAVAQQYPWLAFDGHWGEAHPAFYNGPTGPNAHSQWDMPITWAQTSWHPAAFAIPSGLTKAPESTAFFCSAVAAGSTLLTATVDGGPVVFLAIVVVLLLVLRAVVRMQWRPSQVFHLARRRGLGQILATSARMYRHNPRLYLSIGVLFVPVSIVIALLQRLVFAVTQLDVLADVAGDTNAAVTAAAMAIGLVCGVVVLTVVQAMVATSMAHATEARELIPRTAYAAIRRRIGSLLMALLVVAASLIALQITLVGVPVAIWLLVRWSLFAQCVVLEDLPWRAALARSYALVRGHWWRVAGINLAVVGVALLLGPVLGVALLLTTSTSLAVVNIVSGIVYALTIPYAAIATTYLYYDLRVRELVDQEPARLPAEAVLTGAPAVDPNTR